MTPFCRHLAALLLTLLGADMPVHAQAFYLSGSFSGTAQAQSLPLNFPPPHPASYYDGAAVTGRFEVVVVEPQFQVGGPDDAYFLNGNGGSLSISYTIKDTQFDFLVAMPYGSSDPSVMLLSAGSRSQMVSFLTSFQPKYQGAAFDLTGPPDTLFSGLDADSLHVDPTALPSFATSFASASAEISVFVDVDAVTFQTIRPVPEPGTLALAMAGGVWLAWRRRVCGRGWRGDPPQAQ